MDVVSLLPHCKKVNKVESKETKGATLNELVELRNCSSILFLSSHYGGIGKLTGNHLKGSKADAQLSLQIFDQEPHWKLLQEGDALIQAFKVNGVPLCHVNQSYDVGTSSTKVDVSGVNVEEL
ncbi:hypothetical protein J5N97_026199 [Dioscorea zingiberensis]|uniref:Uncharacterized protein n=1 Tax=Dioscorea zingiberensis TaxID=325984 RepID=A0A9D5C1M2_9LILI|nr:hypothetical protein J5N97_026199 [Dioscorea zingiberensis]